MAQSKSKASPSAVKSSIKKKNPTTKRGDRSGANYEGIPVRHKQVRKLDIMLGRGGYYYTHAGNAMLRRVVAENQHHFNLLNDRGSKKGKTDLSMKIVELMRTRGSRFLRIDKARGGWEDVSEHPTIARDKIATLFREGCKKAETEPLSLCLASPGGGTAMPPLSNSTATRQELPVSTPFWRPTTPPCHHHQVDKHVSECFVPVTPPASTIANVDIGCNNPRLPYPSDMRAGVFTPTEDLPRWSEVDERQPEVTPCFRPMRQPQPDNRDRCYNDNSGKGGASFSQQPPPEVHVDDGWGQVLKNPACAAMLDNLIDPKRNESSCAMATGDDKAFLLEPEGSTQYLIL